MQNTMHSSNRILFELKEDNTLQRNQLSWSVKSVERNQLNQLSHLNLSPTELKCQESLF